MIEFCGICKYRKQESIDSDWVCVNPKSEYCTDRIDYDDSCLEWEMIEDQDKWIPVSERLPEVGKYILATRSKPEEPKVIVMQYCEHIWATGNLSELITAWQPLPEPYKGRKTK